VDFLLGTVVIITLTAAVVCICIGLQLLLERDGGS
jgi:hypothetical protein